MKSPIDENTCHIRHLTDYLNQQEVKKKISERWHETMGSPKNYSKPEVKLLRPTTIDPKMDFTSAVGGTDRDRYRQTPQ